MVMLMKFVGRLPRLRAKFGVPETPRKQQTSHWRVH